MSVINWASGINGNWSTASDWTNGIVPKSADDAIINASGTYSVTISSSVSANSLTLGNSSATVAVANGGKLTLAGSLNLTQGTVQLASGNTTIGALVQSGGELNGAGSVTATGLSSFSGGTESGSGTTLAKGGANFTYNGTFGLDGGRILQLGGSSTATGYSDYIDLNAANPNTSVSDVGSGTLQILAGATFDDQTQAGGGGLNIQASNQGPTDTGSTAAVINQGTFKKTGSATSSTVNALFSTTNGTVDVESGTLYLENGGTDVGASYTGAGTVDFGGGTRTLDSTSKITGSAAFTGGQTTVNGAFTGTGTLSFSGGSATFAAAVTTGALVQSGGELNGAGSVTATGLSSFSGGTESGSGTTLAKGGANFSYNGTFGLDGGRILQLGGSSTATGYSDYIDLNAANPNTSVSDVGSGTLQILAGATFDDQTQAGGGGLNIQASNQGPTDTGSTAAVINQGTFKKTGSATSSTVNALFSTTNGTVDVESGTLYLENGGTDVGASYTGAGTVDFGGGTRTLDSTSKITGSAAFTGGQTTVNGAFTGTGTLSFSGGSATFAAAVTTGALVQSGGELNGAGSVTATGLSSFSGGTESGSGTTLAKGGANFSYNGTFGLDGGRILQLGGSSTATGYSDYIDLNAANPNTSVSDVGSGTLQILAGATFDDQTQAGGGGLNIQASNQGPTDTGSTAGVINQGTFKKTGSATTSTVNALFSTTNGTVDVESGTLALNNGGTDVGARYIGAGTVDFGGGTRTLDSTSKITGSAAFTGGQTTVNGAVTGTGALSVSGGSANFATAVTTGALSVSGGSATFAAAVTTGSLVQSGGELKVTGSVTATGLSSFSGGTESGSGTTLAKGGANFSYNGTFGLDGGRVLQLGGSSTATGYYTFIDLNAVNPNTNVSDAGSGTLQILAGATFDDQTKVGGSGLNINDTNQGTADTGSTAGVINQGTFKKTGSATTSTVNALFSTTNGTVDVESGTLYLENGGTDVGASYTGAGTVDFGGGTRTLDSTSKITGSAAFTGGQTTVNGAFTGTGTLSVGGSGSATFAAAVTTGALVQSGGELNGAGSVTATGLSSFSGGTESGSGTTLAKGGANFSYNGTFGLDGGRILQLGGSSTATGYYTFIDLNAVNPNTNVSDANSGTLQILAGATFDDQTKVGGSGLNINDTNQGPTDTGSTAGVINQGTFKKTGSATTSTVNALFSTTNGTVDVESGTLALNNGGTDVGASYTGAGTVDFGGGTRTLDSTSKITGSAAFTGGQTTVNGAVTGTGALSVSGSGTATFATAVTTGALSVSGGSATFAAAVTTGSLVQSGGELKVTGSVTATGLSSFSGGTESGSGTTLAKGGANFSYNGTFGLDGGRILQLGGSSTATGYYTFIDLNAVNPNTNVSDANAGTLQILAGATFDDQTKVGGSGLNINDTNQGPTDTGSTAGVINQGTFKKTGSATESRIAAAFNNTGTVSAESGTLEFGGTVTNNGTFTAAAAALEFGNAVNGTGTIQIGSGGTAQFDTTSSGTVSVGAGQTVAFTATTTTPNEVLRLLGSGINATSFGATIQGFQGQDVIDLANQTGVTINGFDGTTLSFTSGGTSETLKLSGLAAGDVFHQKSDGANGTDLFLVNTVQPVFTAISQSVSSGDLAAGNTDTFTLTSSVAAVVTGTPTLTLNDGGTATYDAAKSSGTSLVFDYTVGAGQNTASLAAATLNLPANARIKDASGDAFNLALNGLTQTGPVVDTTPPSVSILSQGGNVTAATQTISGTVTDANPGKTVSIYDNAGTTAIATTTLGNGGTWSATVTLVNGANSLVAKDTDAAGNTGSSSPVVYNLVTAPGLPLIAAPSSATVLVGEATAISGLGISQSGNVTGETFTVKLADTNGLLAATGTGVTGSDTKTLTLTGSLAQVGMELASVTDTDATLAPDTITLNATDSFGNAAATKTVAVAVKAMPAIAAPAAATLGVGQATAIAGLSLSESGATTGETFTVTLADTNGVLATTGTGVTGSGGNNLMLTGSLAQVNAALAALKETEGTTAADTITLNASDSFGNTAGSKSVAVTVNAAPVLSLPSSVTVKQGQATAVSLGFSESGNTSAETFTLTLVDSNGLFTATGTGVTGSGTKSLTLTGSLAQVQSALGALTLTDNIAASDTITVSASDSYGNSAGPATVAVNVTPQLTPVIAAPFSATVGVGKATAISGLAFSETGNRVGETFTVTLTDANGKLSATGAGVSGAGTASLRLSGSFAQVGTELASVTDTDNSLTPDTITLNATDSFGNVAATNTVAVTVANGPIITAPTSVIIGRTQSGQVSGVSLSETGASAGETFTVTLKDTNGALSATGSSISGAGTTSLTVAGTLSQVNTALATLTDKDDTPTPDSVVINATDGFANSAGAASIAVTVNGSPVIAAPTTATVGVGQATSIAGLSLSESGNTAAETFTVTVADSNGVLTATGTGVTGSGTKSVTLTGSLSQVNAVLATLEDTEGMTAPDTITLNAIDSFGNASSPYSVTVDTLKPDVASVTTSGPGITNGSGDLGIGASVTITVNTNKPVFVDTTGGTPTIALNDGGTATYASGSGTTSLIFTSVVTAGENSPDLAVTGVSLNGGTIEDAAGNKADLDGAITNPAGTLRIDTSPPAPTLAFASVGAGATPIVSGTAQAAATVTLYDGTTSIGTTTANASTGAYNITGTGLSAGEHVLTATATDGFGQTSAASSPLTVEVGTAATITAELDALETKPDLSAIVITDPRLLPVASVAAMNHLMTADAAALAAIQGGYSFGITNVTSTGTVTSIYNPSGLLTFTSTTQPGGSTTFDSFDASGTLTREDVTAADKSQVITKYGITGQSYTTEQDSYNSAGMLTSQIRTHADGTSASSYVLNPDGSTVLDSFNAAGILTREGKTYADKSQDITKYSGTSPNSVTEHDVINAQGAQSLVDQTQTNGSHVEYIYAANQTLTSNTAESDAFDNFGPGSTTFVFNPSFGQDTIAGFHAGAGANHDVIQIGSATLNQFSDLVGLMTPSGGGGADTLITIDPSDTILLKHVAESSLTAQNFAFTHIA